MPLELGVSQDVLELENKVPQELKDIRKEDVSDHKFKKTLFFTFQVIVWVDPLDGTGEFAKAVDNHGKCKHTCARGGG